MHGNCRIEKTSTIRRQGTKKLSELLDLQYMSSEESEGENVLRVKPLPWLTSSAIQLKRKLDEEKEKNMTPQSKRQLKRKLTGNFLERERPDGSSWMLKKQKQ